MSHYKKSNSRRKSAAVALAVLGVAGLTLASAAQINLTGPDSVQAGVATVAADCQTTTVPVAFGEPTLTGAVYASASVTLSAIDAACANDSYKVALLDENDDLLGSEFPGTVSGTSITVNLGSVDQYDIRKIALTIY